jgi:hypothetical protein
MVLDRMYDGRSVPVDVSAMLLSASKDHAVGALVF